MNKKIVYAILGIVVTMLTACGGDTSEKNTKKFAPPPKAKLITYEDALADWKNQKGLGPIKSIELAELDEDLVKQGEEIYAMKCTACHAPNMDKLGPAPAGILQRRTPEWIMNMILNPEEMAMKDPIGRGLMQKYRTVMANQGLTREDARAVLEYLRTL